MSPAVAGEALLCENVTVYAPKTLGELVEYLLGHIPMAPAKRREAAESKLSDVDLPRCRDRSWRSVLWK